MTTMCAGTLASVTVLLFAVAGAGAGAPLVDSSSQSFRVLVFIFGAVTMLRFQL